MFFRLTHIDDSPVPAPCTISSVVRGIGSGGLLLEPPREEFASSHSDGYSILRLIRQSDAGLAGASAEPYRWLTPAQIQIGRVPPSQEARFLGHLADSTLEIVAEDTNGFIAPRTKLLFVAAPDDPIPETWRDTFDFGGPHMYSIEPEPDETMRKDIQDWMEEETRRARANATSRLERAWKSNP